MSPECWWTQKLVANYNEKWLYLVTKNDWNWPWIWSNLYLVRIMWKSYLEWCSLSFSPVPQGPWYKLAGVIGTWLGAPPPLWPLFRTVTNVLGMWHTRPDLETLNLKKAAEMNFEPSSMKIVVYQIRDSGTWLSMHITCDQPQDDWSQNFCASFAGRQVCCNFMCILQQSEM